MSLKTGSNQLRYSAIYYGSYTNWKNDPRPLIFIMYGGNKYTHAINVHYMNSADKKWFLRTLYLLKKGNQKIDGYNLYKYIKMKRKTIIESCYRVYFTSLLKMKMVGSGLTPFENLTYRPPNDPWLKELNEKLSAKEIDVSYHDDFKGVAYNKNELQERLSHVRNSTPLQKRSVKKTHVTSKASYVKKAPWIKK